MPRPNSSPTLAGGQHAVQACRLAQAVLRRAVADLALAAVGIDGPDRIGAEHPRRARLVAYGPWPLDRWIAHREHPSLGRDAILRAPTIEDFAFHHVAGYVADHAGQLHHVDFGEVDITQRLGNAEDPTLIGHHIVAADRADGDGRGGDFPGGARA